MVTVNTRRRLAPFGLLAAEQPLTRVAAQFLRVIWLALPILLVTGALLIAAEPRRSLASPAFQLKLVLLVCVASLLLLYQTRMFGLLRVFALHALVLALAVAWQAKIQHAPHLYVTAALAVVLKVVIIPGALFHIVKRLNIHREVETVGGIGPTMLAGVGLVALSIVLMLRVTAEEASLADQACSILFGDDVESRKNFIVTNATDVRFLDI